MLTKLFNDSSEKPPLKLLPQEIHGWKMKGKLTKYVGDSIYDYMNGAGEIYIAYNYKELFVQRYSKKGNPEILVEIFDMGSSDFAYGIFSQIRDRGDEVGVGQDSEYQPGLLCFWQDKYFVCIRVPDETNRTKKAVFALGKAILKSINRDGERPSLISHFTESEFQKNSIRYFFRHEILNYHFYVADKNIFNLSEQTRAVLAKYQDGKTYMLVIHYPSKELANESFENFKNIYIPESKGINIIQTENGKWTGVLAHEKYMIVVFDAPDRNSTVEKMESMKKRLME